MYIKRLLKIQRKHIFYSELLHISSKRVAQAFLPPTGLKFAVDTIEGLRERIRCTLPVEAYDSYEKLKAKSEFL